MENAITIWLACSIGLFAADIIGMLVGYLLKSKTPEGFLNGLAFVIFAFFGFTTMLEGTGLLFGDGASLRWVVTIAVAVVFILLCVWTLWKQKKKAAVMQAQNIKKTASPVWEPFSCLYPQFVPSLSLDTNLLHRRPRGEIVVLTDLLPGPYLHIVFLSACPGR